MSLTRAVRAGGGGPGDAQPGGWRLGSAGAAALHVYRRVRIFLGALLALVILIVLLGITEPVFLSASNWKNILVANSSLFIVSVGMTAVLISSGFDLSLGAMMAVSEETLYLLLRAGVPAVPSFVIVLLVGLVIGAALNGMLIGVCRVNFLVVTLGSMTLLYGLTDVVTNGATNTISSHALEVLGNGSVLGVPVPILVVIGTLLVGGFVLKMTSFGRTIYGVGGNREAARIAGIAVPLVVVAVYGFSGMCGALAGLVEAGRLAAATPNTGSTIALTSGAAVLLGGTSLFGGVGGLTGTIVGVLVIAVLGNGVDLLGVSNFWQGVVTGAVLLGALLLDRLQKHGQAGL
ncbi:MAG: ABC transporter permease [Acidimicrobiales bacterium]